MELHMYVEVYPVRSHGHRQEGLFGCGFILGAYNSWQELWQL